MKYLLDANLSPETGRFLRLADQTVEAVNRTLRAFFEREAGSIDLARSLVIIEERRIRIRSAPS